MSFLSSGYTKKRLQRLLDVFSHSIVSLHPGLYLSTLKVCFLFLVVPQLPVPYLTLSANNVTEGQPITLKCSIYSSGSAQVTWFWICGNSNLTGSATATMHDSILTIQSNRAYDGVACYCKVRPSGANDTYSKMSNHMTISVKCKDTIY